MNLLDRLQNSRSAFLELCQAAGYILPGSSRWRRGAQALVAKFVGVCIVTIQEWYKGGRIQDWRYIARLAQLFKIPLAEAVSRFWGETIGDPCPCGCGGKKVIPQPITSKRARRIDYNKAKHLYIKLRCEKCPTVRIYDQEQGHFPLCRRCSYESRGLGAPTKLKCHGDDPYSTVPLERRPHVDDCPREEWVSRKRIKSKIEWVSRKRIKSKIKPPHRSEGCRRVVNRIRQEEIRVKAFLAKEWFKSSPERRERFKNETARAIPGGFYPSDLFPRIRSREKQLSKLSKVCRRLSHENPYDPDILWRLALFVHIVENVPATDKRSHFLFIALLFLPKIVVFDPYSFKPGHQASKGGSRGKNPERSKSLRAKYAKGWLKTKRVWSKKKKDTVVLGRAFPDTAKGLCHRLGCGYFDTKGVWVQYFVLSSKPGPVHYHQPCYLQRGAPIRQKIKELADRYGVSDDTIYRHIKAGILPALTPAGKAAGRKPGGQVRNLQRNWAWYQRHVDGEGYGTIAEDYSGMSRNAVVDAIAWINKHKPPRELVSNKFHPQL
jgi:hypothetical protein